MKFLLALGRRRLIYALVALVVAFGSGVIMQTVLVDQTPMATVDTMPEAMPRFRSSGEALRLPTPPAATLVPFPPPPVMPDRVKTPDRAAPDVQDDARLSPFGFDCAPELVLTRREAAMIEAKLFAPCDQGQIFTFRHDALEFEMATDPWGRAKAVLPALGRAVTVSTSSGERGVEASIAAPDAGLFSRVILTWQGPRVLWTNAYEFGSSRGESGHVWSGSAKTAARAVRGTGGFLVTLGDGSGRSAEVYTFPTGFSPLRGVVELVVEADVDADTCGTIARATALQSSPLGGMSATDVRVTLPDCDRIGEVVQLKNLLQDMRLAGR